MAERKTSFSLNNNMLETNRGISLIVTALSVMVVLIIGFFAYQEFFSHAGVKENINFSRTGNLVINNPGLEENVWYLIYETPGSPAATTKLSFDDKSVCKTQDESCLSLVVGDRVSVKGIEGDGKVLVRELEVIGGTNVSSGPSVVEWETAVALLDACRVDSASADHSREVYLTLDDGSKIFTVEPKDSSISDKLKEIEKKCGKIPFAIE